MRRHHHPLVVVGTVLLVAILVEPASANSSPDSLATLVQAAMRQTADVRRIVALSHSLPKVVGTGVLVGTGIGAVIGSTVAYRRWNERLS